VRGASLNSVSVGGWRVHDGFPAERTSKFYEIPDFHKVRGGGFKNMEIFIKSNMVDFIKLWNLVKSDMSDFMKTWNFINSDSMDFMKLWVFIKSMR
jgi:hypothetical protein